MLFHQRATAEKGGAPGRVAQSPNQLEQTPTGGVQASVQPNFSSNYVYFKREYLPFVYYQKDRKQVQEEILFFFMKISISLVKVELPLM